MADGHIGAAGEVAVWHVVQQGHKHAHAPAPIHLLEMVALPAQAAILNHELATEGIVQVSC